MVFKWNYGLEMCLVEIIIILSVAFVKDYFVFMDTRMVPTLVRYAKTWVMMMKYSEFAKIATMVDVYFIAMFVKDGAAFGIATA